MSSPCVLAHHPAAEIGVHLNVARRARMVGPHAVRVGREAERERDVELFERTHLAIEPRVCVGAQTVRPAQTRPEVLYAQLSKPCHAGIKARVFEMKPLADSQ